MVKQLRCAGKTVAVTASTGLAANILSKQGLKAQTLHRFSGIKDGRYSYKELCERVDGASDCGMEEICQQISVTDCLVVDEVSMVSASVFDQVETVLRRIKGNSKLFGGTQVILCGDFFQLKPVPNDRYFDSGAYVFQSPSFQASSFHHVTLKAVYRQDEGDLVQCVAELCSGTLSTQSDQLLRRLARPLPPGPEPLNLYAHNYDVEVKNSMELLKMPGNN